MCPQKFLIPRFRLCRAPKQSLRAPDQAQRSAYLRFCFGPLRILDGVRTRPLVIEQAQKPANIDRLAGRIEHVERFWRCDANAERFMGEIQIDNTDRQPAV